MLYAYQGGAGLKRLAVGHRVRLRCKSSRATTQGDLERVVVTLVWLENLGGKLSRSLRVGYEAHGDVKYFPPENLSWEDGTHPVRQHCVGGTFRTRR